MGKLRDRVREEVTRPGPSNRYVPTHQCQQRPLKSVAIISSAASSVVSFARLVLRNDTEPFHLGDDVHCHLQCLAACFHVSGVVQRYWLASIDVRPSVVRCCPTCCVPLRTLNRYSYIVQRSTRRQINPSSELIRVTDGRDTCQGQGFVSQSLQQHINITHLKQQQRISCPQTTKDDCDNNKG